MHAAKQPIRSRMKAAAYLLPLFVLPSCDAAPDRPQQVQTAEIYRNARDGLCLVGDGSSLRAGLVTYGPDDANCSLAGAATRSADGLVLAPAGDAQCRIDIRIEGQRAVIGRRSEHCTYYCGPGADYSARVLQRSEDRRAVTDLAGDPLC